MSEKVIDRVENRSLSHAAPLDPAELAERLRIEQAHDERTRLATIDELAEKAGFIEAAARAAKAKRPLR